MRRNFSSTVTRLPSVGCAVSVGRMRRSLRSAWISRAGMRRSTASASTALKEPRSAWRPSVRSTWRRRRMAVFCSAMEMSWNQMPCTCSARAISSGEKSEMLALPCSTPSSSGSWRRQTSSSEWNRMSIASRNEVPVITGGANDGSAAPAGTGSAWFIVGPLARGGPGPEAPAGRGQSPVGIGAEPRAGAARPRNRARGAAAPLGSGQAARRREAMTCAMVAPNSPGLGATVSP